MYLKFLIPKLLSISFSDKDLLVGSKSSEASHDCHMHTQKKIDYHKSTSKSLNLTRKKEEVLYLNSTVMEDVSEPRESSVLVALVEKLDLFSDDLFSLRT